MKMNLLQYCVAKRAKRVFVYVDDLTLPFPVINVCRLSFVANVCAYTDKIWKFIRSEQIVFLKIDSNGSGTP